jgi:type II secretory pathway pseudopilin PulG
VVAVILILAAIAIPNFIQSKMRTNESAAGQSLRTLTTAEALYSTSYGIGYSPDLPSLGGSGATPGPTNAELVDAVLSSGIKSGYTFNYTALTTDALGNVTSYSVNANPTAPGYTGMRYFYADQTGVIRGNFSAPAGPTDNPLQ